MRVEASGSQETEEERRDRTPVPRHKVDLTSINKGKPFGDGEVFSVFERALFDGVGKQLGLTFGTTAWRSVGALSIDKDVRPPTPFTYTVARLSLRASIT